MARKSDSNAELIDEVIGRLDDDEVRRLLGNAAANHDDVERAVRLSASSAGARIQVLKVMVDDGLRTRRHLDYWESTAWAEDAAPMVDALALEVETAPTAELVVLLQRAAGHLMKVIMRADDSNGMIGDLAGRVLELHGAACEAGVAEPVQLAKWMVRFTFDDQDFVPLDPVEYRDALGDKGLAVYRREVAKRSVVAADDAPKAAWVHESYAGLPSYAAFFAAERLAIIDRDVPRLIELLGGDQTEPYQFTRVATALVELGLLDDALVWARRGIAETSGRLMDPLYDLAAELLAQAGSIEEVVNVRRDHHERTPDSSTYAKLREAANELGVWPAEIGAARAVLADKDSFNLIEALLSDDDADEAWTVATSGSFEPGARQWLRLAQAREPKHPGDAMTVYLRLADEVLQNTSTQAYRDAVRHLTAARRASVAAGQESAFNEHLAGVRDRNKRRPNFMAKLERAGMGSGA